MTTISKAVLEPILKYMRDTPVDDWPLSFVVSPENMVETITARRRVLARENTLTDEDSQRAVVILSSPDIEKPVMLMTDEVIAKCGSMYLKNKISRFRQILKDEDDRARDVLHGRWSMNDDEWYPVPPAKVEMGGNAGKCPYRHDPCNRLSLTAGYRGGRRWQSSGTTRRT